MVMKCTMWHYFLLGRKTFCTKALYEPPTLWKIYNMNIYYINRSHMDVLWLYTLEKSSPVNDNTSHCATAVLSFHATKPFFKLHCLHFSNFKPSIEHIHYNLAWYECTIKLQPCYLSTSKWSAGGQHGDVLHVRKAFHTHTVP